MISETMLPETSRDSDKSDVAFHDMEQTWERWADRRVRFFDFQKDAAESALAVLGIIMPIDEIAIMVTDEHQEYHLLEGAVRNGWRVFNAAEDAVETYPIKSEYRVHYTFLDHPETGYRLEIMRLLDGISPLHMALSSNAFLADHLTPVMVHASFKVKDLTQLGEIESRLTDSGSFMLAQGCRSTYGAFAYYARTESNDLGSDDLTVYLKPRVNLRDQA
jgi:hypothetical protein